MKKAIFGAFIALSLVAALATSQSGIVLPSGSNTLKSIHLSGTPDLGIYFPTSSTMYVGGSSGGTTFSDSGMVGGFGDGTVSLPSMSFASQPDTGFYLVSSGVIGASVDAQASFYLTRGIAQIQSDGQFSWSNSASNAAGSTNTALVSDAANTLALKNSTNEQEFRIYGVSGTSYLSSGEGGLQGGKTGTFVDETALDVALVAIAQSGAAVGEFAYGAKADTSLEVSSGRATFACTNIADTETCDIDIIAESTTAAASTITCVPTIDTDETDAVMFVLTCNEEAGDNGGTIYARFDLLTQNTITWQ